MKKRVTFIICVVLALALFTACGETVATPDAVDDSAYQKITAADGKELLENGAELTLVDVRRADEYEIAHIPGAVNVPNESIESEQPDALPDFNKTIVVYCRTGVRSEQAAEKLVKMGYTDVRDMGGIADWPYDTIAGTEPGEYIGTDSDSESNVESESNAGTASDRDSESNAGANSKSDAGNGSNTGSRSDTDTDATADGLMSDFSAKDLEGNDIDQSVFAENDLTMVNAWATYCGPCLSEMPELGMLAEDYEGKGVGIVGLVTDVLGSDGTASESQIDTARDIVAETGAGYLHIVPSADLYGLLSQITVVPTTFFVDSNGSQVGSTYLGSRSKAEWNKIIVKTLEEIQK